MRNWIFIAALSAIPGLAGAQNTAADREKISSTVPANMLPPAGKCRIWMVGVAPAQQPAPTDCQTALRQRPTNGVVVFGPVEREPATSQFRGRPTVEQGPEDRPRAPAAQSRRRVPSPVARPSADSAKKPPAESPESRP